MRYDDYDDFDSRSSRNSSYRRGDSASRDRRSDYRGDYSRDSYYRSDRDYRDTRSRNYRDRDYRNDYSRDRNDRYDDRYATRRTRGSDIDLSDWERTAPNWDDRSAERRKKNPRSNGGSRSESSRNSRSCPPRHSSGSTYRSRDRGRNDSRARKPAKTQKRLHFLPIVVALIALIVAALVIRSLVGGGGNSTKYSLEFSTRSIVMGDTATVTVTGIPDGEEPAIAWSSNDTGVVSITEGKDKRTCTITAKSVGQAMIAATVGDQTVSKTVTVVKTAQGVESIQVSEETATMLSGDTYQINATVTMEDGLSPAKIHWTSSDSSVAKVDDNGLVTGRDVGTAIIKGTAGEQTVEVAITVEENPNAQKDDMTESVGNEPEDGTGTQSSDTTDSQDNSSSEDTTGTGTTEEEPADIDTDIEPDEAEIPEDLGSEITGETPADTTE